MQTWRVTTILTVLGLTIACGTETIVHKTDERQANRIIEVLADSGIKDAGKSMVDTGREVYFMISVPKSQRLTAIRVLNDNELPTPEDQGYSEVFVEGGLIPTNAEERAKSMQALEGELQRQLKLIEGILDVQVQVVIPEEDALRTTRDQVPDTTASVTVKYLPGAGGAKPLSEPQIQAVVAAGVENLTPDRVVVVMTQGGSRRVQTGGERRTCKGFWCLPPKQLNMIAMAVLGFVLLLSLGLIYAQLRLRSVRGRLIRLQTEIARARRKPSGSSPTG